MNKFTILFLTLFLALPIAMKADSAKEKKDDSRYLVGAVPEVDGKVIFSKEFQIPGMSQAQIYDTVMKWMTERLKENQNVDSRVVYADEDKGTIAGIQFQRSFIRPYANQLPDHRYLQTRQLSGGTGKNPFHIP